MMRFRLRASFCLLIMCILLIVVMMGIGTFAPPHPAVTSFESCNGTPCWLHIDIQHDTPLQAVDLLEAQGYVSLENGNYLAPDDARLCDLALGTLIDDRKIYSIQLLNCHDLRLGDVWSVFGAPTMIANDCFNNWMLWYGNTIVIIMSGALKPDQTVNQIAFYDPDQLQGTPYGVPWHGFTSQWRYNQLEGNIRGC
jgi:hypothetical protein